MNLVTVSRFAVRAGVLGLLAFAGCEVNLPFDIPKDFPIDAMGMSLTTTQAVDLSTIKEVQDHKAAVQHLSLDSADVSVTAIGAMNMATSLTGQLALRAASAPADGSQDVQVGQLSNVPISIGSKVHLPGSPALDAFLLAQVKGSGMFSIVVNGMTAGGPAHLTLHAVLHASLGYGS